MISLIIKICGIIGLLLIVNFLLTFVQFDNETVGSSGITVGIIILILVGVWAFFKAKVSFK